MQKSKLPVLFIGHGSPMNAIANNNYTQTLQKLGRSLPKPEVILCVSAHWMTKGTWVTAMAKPKTIHDFGGFPDELFQIQYPAPGSPQTASLICDSFKDFAIQKDEVAWGLDHGSWSVLRHLYPQADIPVVQLSLDMTKGPEFHFQLGQALDQLRSQGVMIIGSGNIVHNLRKIRWEAEAEPFPWAVQFDSWVKKQLEDRNFTALYSEAFATPEGKLSIPTPDHYYPLLYAIGCCGPKDSIRFEFDGIQNASISMLSLGIYD